MIDKVTVRSIGADEAQSCIDGLTDVLIDCVEGGASVSFMLPMGRDKALEFWRSVATDVARGGRVLLVAEDECRRIAGTVQIITAQPDNQPHRADIAKLLVHRNARRRGIGQQLMSAAEVAARENGKNVLVLDTATGGDAERLYQRAGWRRAGEIPNYALMPTGELCGTTFYCKEI